MNKGPLTPELQAEVMKENELDAAATAFLKKHGVNATGRVPEEMPKDKEVPLVYNAPKKP